MKYDRPVRELLLDCCREQSHQFSVEDAVVWFGQRYPDVSANTVRTQFHALLREAGSPLHRDGRGRYHWISASVVALPVAATGTPTSSGIGAPPPQPDRVLLLGCVKSKTATPQPARALYLSPLWQKRRTYADSSGVPWFVLSAKWGVVNPDDVIAPYDMALKNMSRGYRVAWGEFVAEQLATRLALRGLTLEVHAGDEYVDSVRTPLGRRGATVLDLVDATSMGATLAWYGTARRGTARPDTDPHNDPGHLDGQVSAALGALSRSGLAQNVDRWIAAFPATASRPGLYTWWVDQEGAEELARGLGVPLTPGLIYVGQAGATRTGGRGSRNTLRGRIDTMHLNGTRSFSTLRFSLGVLLDAAAATDDHGSAEDALSDWMRRHLRIAVWPTDDPDSLGIVEDRVLTALDPPLNLRGMASSPMRYRLSELRSRSSR